jgi:hypothetical protein
MLYMMTGTLNMADLAQRLPPLLGLRSVEAALAFLLVGISLKLALFPLHLWLPNAYAFAPTVVTVFLAATATKVSVYVMIRIIYTVFGGAPVFEQLVIDNALMGLGMLSMIAAAVVAVFQQRQAHARLLDLSQIVHMVLGSSLGASPASPPRCISSTTRDEGGAVHGRAAAFSRRRGLDRRLAGLGQHAGDHGGDRDRRAQLMFAAHSFVTKWYLVRPPSVGLDRLVVVLASGLIAVAYLADRRGLLLPAPPSAVVPAHHARALVCLRRLHRLRGRLDLCDGLAPPHGHDRPRHDAPDAAGAPGADRRALLIGGGSRPNRATVSAATRSRCSPSCSRLPAVLGGPAAGAW